MTEQEVDKFLESLDLVGQRIHVRKSHERVGNNPWRIEYRVYGALKGNDSIIVLLRRAGFEITKRKDVLSYSDPRRYKGFSFHFDAYLYVNKT